MWDLGEHGVMDAAYFGLCSRGGIVDGFRGAFPPDDVPRDVSLRDPSFSQKPGAAGRHEHDVV